MPADQCIEGMVTEFHRAFGHPVPDVPALPDQRRLALRMSLIWEEVEELSDAREENDLVGIADALADLAYVTVGMAIECGLPFTEVFREVHAANMRKLGPDGKPIYREDGKVVKPDGWTEPDIVGAISGALDG